MMAKESKKKIHSHLKIVVANLQINGTNVGTLNYERTEYDDGTVVEMGGPDNTPAGAWLGQFLGTLMGAPGPKGKRRGRA